MSLTKRMLGDIPSPSPQHPPREKRPARPPAAAEQRKPKRERKPREPHQLPYDIQHIQLTPPQWATDSCTPQSPAWRALWRWLLADPAEPAMPCDAKVVEVVGESD